jgi:hypothetical protein
VGSTNNKVFRKGDKTKQQGTRPLVTVFVCVKVAGDKGKVSKEVGKVF